MEAQEDSPTRTLHAITSSTGKEKKCPYCPSEFRKADHFHRHVRSHTKEKPFRCHICRKAYPRHDTLLRHARTHKQDSNSADPPKKALSNGQAPTKHQDNSPSSNFSGTSRAMTFEGPVATLYQGGSPGLYPIGISLAQTHPEDVQIPSDGAVPSFSQSTSPQDTSRSPQTTVHNFQSQIDTVSTLNQLQNATSTLVTPPHAENDITFLAQSNHFGIHEPLGTHAFDGLSDFSSERWLLEDDFDFTIFDQMAFSSTLHEPPLTHGGEAPRSMSGQVIEKSRHRPFIPDLRHVWYIQIPGTDLEPETSSETVTPQNKHAKSSDNIDETYRAKLASTLCPPLRDEPLPSMEFLNLCIHLFFTRFNVALPLIHSPTFRSTHGNALLVLSICSAGCLSLGSASATRTGSMLFERVNKAIVVAPWERVISRTGDQTWNVLKAAMIGQTYALISEDPAHRATAAAYHGSLIALARHHKLLSPAPAFHLQDDLSAEQLEKVWRSWAREEELRRVAVLLYIHDAELAALFHHEPVFRHDAGYIPTVCSQELFSAPSAVIWASSFRAEQRERRCEVRDIGSQTPHLSSSGDAGLSCGNHTITSLQQGLGWQNMFNVYNGLSGIGASICECRHLDLLSSAMTNKFECDLLTWYSSTPKAFKTANDQSKLGETPFSLLPLWHYSFLALSTNLNLLEIAVGREGSEIASSTRQYVLSWVASPGSKRCLLHALLLQSLIVSTNIGALVAIHTPRILFSAALCWYCYMVYIPASSLAPVHWEPPFPEGILEPLNNYPEIQLLRESNGSESLSIYPVPHILDETIARLPKILTANPTEVKANTLCVIESILRRLGTSGVSLRFADIIQAFISGEPDKTSTDQRTS